MEIAVYHFADGSRKVFIDGQEQKEPAKHIEAPKFTIDVYKAEKQEEQT